MIDGDNEPARVGSPSVGIFFVVNDRLLFDAVPLEQGDPYGDTIGHGSHYEFWETFVPQTELEREFKKRAYDAYPRGRVVYFTREKRFVLYADPCLERDVLHRLAERFGITEPVFARDEHYQCATCNPFFVD
ncbi:MAG: hypothetical protein MUC51_11725 [Anaerolineae bacterium]|jgi:hypothetical protein|nr:hypothetical protein [Anaerolineae bacterium]